MDEQQAIAQLKHGDISGLEVLVRKYQVQAVRLADLITRDLPVAEDIVQAAFLRAYERIEQFDSRRHFGPWFLRGVVNDAIKAASRRQRLVSLEAEAGDTGLSLADVLPLELPGPEQAAEREDVRQAVWSALGKLPPEQRAAVIRRYFPDLFTTGPVEEQTSLSSTLRWRVHAGLKRLRRLLGTIKPDTRVRPPTPDAPLPPMLPDPNDRERTEVIR